MSRRAKIALISIASVLAVLGLFTGGILLLLSTAAGSRFLLSQLRSQLEKRGAKVEYTAGEIYPFSILHFENLKITQVNGENRNAVFLKLLDAKFRVSLFSRSIEFERFLVDSPTITLHSRSTANALTPTPTPEKKNGNGGAIAQMRRLVESPPVKVWLKQFALENLSLDVDYADSVQSVVGKLKGLSAHASFEMRPAVLAFSGDFKMDQATSFRISRRADDETQEIAFQPLGSVKGAASVRREGNVWKYEVAPTAGAFGLRDITLQTTNPKASGRFTLAQLVLNSNLKFLATTRTLFQLEPGAIKTVEIKNAVRSGKGSFVQTVGKKKSLTAFESQAVQFNADLAEAIRIRADYEIRKLSAKDVFTKPTDVMLESHAKIANDLTNLKGNFSGRFGPMKWLTGGISGAAGEALTFDAKANLDVSGEVARLFTSAVMAREVGALTGLMAFKARKNEGTVGSFAEVAQLFEAPGEGDLRLELEQPAKLRKPSASGALMFEPIRLKGHYAKTDAKTAFQIWLQTKALQQGAMRIRDAKTGVEGEVAKTGSKAKWTAEIGEARLLASPKPLSLGLVSNLLWDVPTGRLDADGELKVQNEKAAKFKLGSTARDGKLTADGSFEAFFGKYLAGIITEAQLDRIGTWKTHTDLKITAENTSSVAFAKDGILTAEGSTTLTQADAPGDRIAAHRFRAEPIQMNHKVNLDNGKLAATFSASAPRLEQSGVGRVNDTQINANASSPNLAAAKDIDVRFTVKQGEIVLAKEILPQTSPAPPKLTGLNVSLKANVRGDRFSLEELTGDFNKAMIRMQAEATGKVKQQDFQMRGNFTAEVPPEFPTVAEHKIQGRIDFPWTLSVLQGTDVTFGGSLDVKNVNWSMGGQRVRGVSGRIPVSEKLMREGSKVKFSHLITQNPFERVDYERLRPLMHDAEQLRIEAIGIEEKNYGPFVGFFSMRQNMIVAHQFDFTLGKTGLAYGEMYLDVYPANLQLGFLTRLTALDLVDILPKKYLPNIPRGDKNVSGRAGMVVNLNRGTVDGRIDITEIGAGQLLTLINVLDPKYEDDKMNMSRSALGLGYPSFVEMVFQKGYLDLGMDIVLVGVSNRFTIRAIPISALVSNATADIVKKTQEGPLK